MRFAALASCAFLRAWQETRLSPQAHWPRAGNPAASRARVMPALHTYKVKRGHCVGSGEYRACNSCGHGEQTERNDSWLKQR